MSQQEDLDYLERVACIIDQRKNEAEMQIKEMQESLENKQEEKRALENLANEYAKKIMMCKSEIRLTIKSQVPISG